MTIADILRDLEGSTGWSLSRDGAIRHGLHCPLTWLHTQRIADSTITDAVEYLDTIDDLGVSFDDADLIVQAADGVALHVEDWDDVEMPAPALRKRLLAACSLTDVA